MVMTHARCGGDLIPIEDSPRADHYVERRPDYARCDRCGLPGEVAPIPDRGRDDRSRVWEYR